MEKIGLNSNQLKIIAAVCMVFDHVGVLIFPEYKFLRIIGRIAFPIFAFCLSQGCRYTKNRRRYLLTMLFCAASFQLVYFFTTGAKDVNIFGTLTLSISLSFLFDLTKNRKITSALLFCTGILAVYVLTSFVKFDYGFVGVLLPLSAYVFEEKWPKFLCFSFTLATLAAVSGWNLQYYALLAVPILLLYNGSYGSKKFKYWFYIFYPVHIATIYGISLLIK